MAAKTVKRPPQHPSLPQCADYWAPRTRKRHQHQHRPQRATERSDATQHAKGRTGDCPGPRKETPTGRNVTQGGRRVGLVWCALRSWGRCAPLTFRVVGSGSAQPTAPTLCQGVRPGGGLQPFLLCPPPPPGMRACPPSCASSAPWPYRGGGSTSPHASASLVPLPCTKGGGLLPPLQVQAWPPSPSNGHRNNNYGWRASCISHRVDPCGRPWTSIGSALCVPWALSCAGQPAL